MAMLVLGQSDSPGNEQRDFWGSAAADQPRLEQLHRHQDPVVDELIERRDRRARPREPGRPHPRARPRAALGLLRHPAWYSSADRGAVLEQVLPSRRCRRSAACRSTPGGTTRPRRRALAAEMGGNAAARARRAACSDDRRRGGADDRLHRPPPAADRPDAVRDHADQFPDHPDGAGRAGRADDRPADRPGRGDHRAGQRAAAAARSLAATGGRPAASSARQVPRRARGSIPEFIAGAGEAVRLRQAAARALLS